MIKTHDTSSKFNENTSPAVVPEPRTALTLLLMEANYIMWHIDHAL